MESIYNFDTSTHTKLKPHILYCNPKHENPAIYPRYSFGDMFVPSSTKYFDKYIFMCVCTSCIILY